MRKSQLLGQGIVAMCYFSFEEKCYHRCTAPVKDNASSKITLNIFSFAQQQICHAIDRADGRLAWMTSGSPSAGALPMMSSLLKGAVVFL